MTKQEFRITQHQLYISNLKTWINLLFQNNNIDKNYLGHYVKISLASLVTQPVQALESALYDKKIKQSKLHPSPVFILGHWRSGTTHLHYLLSCDPQFGLLTNYQAFLFNISLLGGNKLKHLVKPLFPENRIMDNMLFSTDLPAEEELPFSNISGTSAYHSMWFPGNDLYFRKYALMESISPEELENWKQDYLFMLKKIASSQKKARLVLKNPFNTGRIKALLGLFPDAKFIHIYRNPFDVYKSTLHWYHKVVKTQFLQPFSEKEIVEKTIRYYQLLMKAYFEQKALVPPQNLIEIPFEDLEEKPISILKSIYDHLNLGDLKNSEPALSNYLTQTKNYQKNQFQLDEEEVEMIVKAWEPYFKKFSYSPFDSKAI